jgi:hypothetical protein
MRVRPAGRHDGQVPVSAGNSCLDERHEGGRRPVALSGGLGADNEQAK